MSTTSAPRRQAGPPASSSGPGPLGRLGRWVTEHATLVTVGWLLAIVGLGAVAPQVEHNTCAHG